MFSRNFLLAIITFKSVYHKNAVFSRCLRCYAFCFLRVILLFQELVFVCIKISEGAKTSQKTQGIAVGKPAAFLLPKTKGGKVYDEDHTQVSGACSLPCQRALRQL